MWKYWKTAYTYLKDKNEILFFVDKNAKEIKEIQEFKIPVYEPKELLNYQRDIKIVIASIWWREILDDIKDLGIIDLDMEIFKIGIDPVLSDEIKESLDRRTINLGSFLSTQSAIHCKELTFIPGGSRILDFVFLKQIAILYECREYLEIGTYIGESINVLTECCERLYSVTALPGSPYSMKYWCREAELPDYSERLTYNERIVHYFTDSKQFDFSKHADTVDLYFIDGDHSYSGVYYDTKNIFDHKKEDAIVVWHDFKKDNKYNVNVVTAVNDILGNEFENVYVTDNNMCGIYIPKSRKFEFDLHRRRYEENAILYTYDVNLVNCRIYNIKRDI